MFAEIGDKLREEQFMKLLALSAFDASEWQIAARVERYLSAPDVRSFAWLEADSPLGLLVVTEADKEVTIEDFAVSPERQREGIGGRMIGQLIGRYGDRTIAAETDDDALEFYLKCGFTVDNIRTICDTKRYLCRLDPVAWHYDRLIDENNDPVLDPPELQNYMNQWDGDMFLQMLKLNSDMDVLEVGVGTGRLALRIAPLCRSYVGIDVSLKTLERAKAHLGSMENVRLRLVELMKCEETANFDLIYSSLTFMHMRDKKAAVAKVSQMLRSGGRFILSLDKNRDEMLVCGERRLRIYPDDPDGMQGILKDAGFHVTDVVETRFAWLLAAVKEG